MEALEAILTRRSIRRYTAEPISEETVRKLLEAACSAPSANNQQPWAFVVIDDRELLDTIPDQVHPYSKMLKEAPLAILVCGVSGRERHPGYWEQDCAAATENLLLAAHGLGLGAVWLGVHPREQRVEGMRRLLGIPDDVVPFSLISIGHPAEEKPPSDRYDAHRVHHNRW
ncbi:MAG: nitroreductase family protein [Anaerolineae bacterium]